MTRALTPAPATTLPDTSAGAEYERLVKSFVRTKRAAGLAPGTVANYANCARRFGVWLAAQGMPLAPASITREHVETWFVVLREQQSRFGRPLSSVTIQSLYLDLQQFFVWLRKEGEIRISPMAEMDLPKAVTPPVAIYTEDDLRRLLKTCEAQRSFEGRRDYALLRLLIDTGLRIGEAGGLKTTDVDLDNQCVTVLGKGHKIRVVPFNEKATAALDRYERQRHNHKFAGVAAFWVSRIGTLDEHGLAKRVKARAEQAGMPKLHAHSLRHQFAHLWLADGGQEGDLMRLGGWSSRAMLNRYGASGADARAHKAARERRLGDRI